MAYTRYHKILGVAENATDAEIKKAYRRLAKQYHPDANPSRDAQKQFVVIQKAYDYLISGKHKQIRYTANTQSTNYTKPRTPREAAEQRREEWRKSEAYKQYARRRRTNATNETTYDFKAMKKYAIGMIIFFVVGFSVNSLYETYMLGKNTVEGTCLIRRVYFDEVYYEFYFNGRRFYNDKKNMRTSWEGKVVSPNGMPIRRGDSFKVMFNKEQPQYHKIEYDKFSKSTLDRYMVQASYYVEREYIEERHPSLNANTLEMKLFIACFTEAVYHKKGIDGLANLVFYDEPWIENFGNNKYSYRKMMKDEEVKQAFKDCETLLTN